MELQSRVWQLQPVQPAQVSARRPSGDATRRCSASISTTGGFASGYTATQEDETIVLKNVDLTLSGTQTDQHIIQQLLADGQLHMG